MFSFIWTYLLPSTSIALVIALLWAQRQARTLAVQLAQLQTQHDELGYQLEMARAVVLDQQRAVSEWKYASQEAMRRMNEARAELDSGNARLEAAKDRIANAEVPADAEGAMAWMKTQAGGSVCGRS